MHSTIYLYSTLLMYIMQYLEYSSLTFSVLASLHLTKPFTSVRQEQEIRITSKKRDSAVQLWIPRTQPNNRVIDSYQLNIGAAS